MFIIIVNYVSRQMTSFCKTSEIPITRGISQNYCVTWLTWLTNRKPFRDVPFRCLAFREIQMLGPVLAQPPAQITLGLAEHKLWPGPFNLPMAKQRQLCGPSNCQDLQRFTKLWHNQEVLSKTHVLWSQIETIYVLD